MEHIEHKRATKTLKPFALPLSGWSVSFRDPIHNDTI